MGMGDTERTTSHDVTETANQMLRDLYRSLVEPTRILLGVEAAEVVEQRLVARVDILATALVEGEPNEQNTVAETLLALAPLALNDRDRADWWWATPVGRACHRDLVHHHRG
jgi:hypothetical protein